MIKKSLSFFCALSGSLLVIFGVSAQDEVQLPELTGPYQVGQAIYHLIDDSRPELRTDDPDDVRELMLYVYYPAEPPTGAEPVPYVDAAMREGFAASGMADDAFFAVIDPVRPHAFADVPLSQAETSYPVLLFMPGGVGMPYNYTALLEELASHGYVVVATSQPYYSLVTAFPDGRVAIGYFEYLEDPNFVYEVDFDAWLETWSQDAKFVLDQLEAFNEADLLFARHLDLERIGMFGHSMGGATTYWMCQNDHRILAGVGLDSPFILNTTCSLCKEMIRTDISQPVMFMTTLSPFASPRTVLELGYILRIAGTDHYSFSDDPLVWRGEAFRSRGEQVVATINTYLVAFFDKHVKGQEVTLLDGPSPDFPDVTFELVD